MPEPNLGMYPSVTSNAPATSAAGSSANIGLFNASEPKAMAEAVTGVGTAFKGLSSTVNDFVSTANSKIDSLIQKVGGLSKSVQGAQSTFGQAGSTGRAGGGGSGIGSGWSTVSQGSALPNGGQQAPGWNAQGPYVQPTAGGPGVTRPTTGAGGVGVGGATGGGPPLPNGGAQPKAGGSFPWKTAGAVAGVAAVSGLAAAGQYGASQMAPMEAVDLAANRLAGGQPGPYSTAQKTRTMNQMYNALNTGGATSPQDIAAGAGILGGATGVGPVGSQAFGQAAGTAGLAAILNPGIGATGGAQVAQGLYSPQTFQKFRSLGLRPPIGQGHTLAPVQDVLNQVATRVNRGQPLTQQQAAQGFYQGSYLTSTFNQLGIDPTMAQQVLQKETQWQADPRNRGKPVPQLTTTDKSGQPKLNQGAVKALGIQDTAANALLQTQQEKMGAQENMFPGMAKAVQDFQGAVGRFWDAVNKLTGGGTGVGGVVGQATGILGGGGGLGGQGGSGPLGGITNAIGSFYIFSKLKNLFTNRGGGAKPGEGPTGPTSGGKPGGPKPGEGEPGGKPKDATSRPSSPRSPRPTPKPGGGGGIWDDITGTIKDWLGGGKGGNIWTGKPGGGVTPGGEDAPIPEVPIGGPTAPTPTTQTPGQTGSPTTQKAGGTRLADFQPGGPSTIQALSNMADQLGLQHTITAKEKGQDDDTFHAHHNAIDLAPGTAGGKSQKDSPGLLTLNRELAKKFGPGLVELIYGGPGGTNIKNGKVVAPSVYGPKVMAQHHSHVHVAATEGSLKAAGITLQGRKSTVAPGKPTQPATTPGGAADPNASGGGPVGNINNKQDFAKALLSALGVSTAPALVNAVVKWEDFEEGNWTGTPHPNLYNPLNTGRQEPGSTSTGSQGGMVAYPDWATGVKATADTIRQGNMAPIYNALKAGNIAQLQAALQSSPWSGSKYPGLNLGGGSAPASGGAAPAPSASTSQQKPSTPGGGGGARPPTSLGEGASTMESSIIGQSFQMQKGGGARGAAPKPTQAGAPGANPPAPGNLMHATPEAAKAYAQTVAQKRGWNFADWDFVANAESGWRWNAANPSGAYGIPQALPGSKMASAGPDWRDNSGTQINWMADYMQSRWGGASGAAAQERSAHWYHTGAWEVAKDELARLKKGEMVVPPDTAEAVRRQSRLPAPAGGTISVVFQKGAFMIQKAPISEAECEQIGNRVARSIKKKAVQAQLVSD